MTQSISVLENVYPMRMMLSGASSLTSNKSFEEWGEVFGDEVMAEVLIDRLLHHCHIVNVRGNSYRLRHHVSIGCN